jgi:hypothetical protein
LLDQTLDHVGNTEVALTAIWFVDGLAPGRTRGVSAIEKLLSDHGPVFAEMFREIVDRDPVGAATNLSVGARPWFDRTFFQALSRLAGSTIFSINCSEEGSRVFVIVVMAAGSD